MCLHWCIGVNNKLKYMHVTTTKRIVLPVVSADCILQGGYNLIEPKLKNWTSLLYGLIACRYCDLAGDIVHIVCILVFCCGCCGIFCCQCITFHCDFSYSCYLHLVWLPNMKHRLHHNQFRLLQSSQGRFFLKATSKNVRGIWRGRLRYWSDGKRNTSKLLRVRCVIMYCWPWRCHCLGELVN